MGIGDILKIDLGNSFDVRKLSIDSVIMESLMGNRSSGLTPSPFIVSSQAHGNLSELQARLADAENRNTYLEDQLHIADKRANDFRCDNQLLISLVSSQRDMISDLMKKLHASTNPAPVAAQPEPRAFPAQALAGGPARIGLITTFR